MADNDDPLLHVFTLRVQQLEAENRELRQANLRLREQIQLVQELNRALYEEVRKHDPNTAAAYRMPSRQTGDDTGELPGLRAQE